MALETLTLENFQAHKKRVIKFDRRVTVVRGETDVGKSAIIRALGWVAFNRPDGDDFVNWDADCAVVTLEVDGQIIVRSRGKGENGYLLNGDEFKAFGKEVPERIAELLRMDSVNFQSQHDSPFWMTETAGEVSRRLNHVINLGVIDDVLAMVSGRSRKARSTVDVCEDRIRKAKKTRDDLAFVPDMDTKLQVVEAAHKEHDRLKKKVAALRTALESAVEHARRAKEARAVVTRGLDVVASGDFARGVTSRAQLLHEVIVSAELLRKAANVKLPDISALTALKASYETTAARREKLADAMSHLRTLWRARRDTGDAAKAAHDELHKNMKGNCPICGNELHE